MGGGWADGALQPLRLPAPQVATVSRRGFPSDSYTIGNLFLPCFCSRTCSLGITLVFQTLAVCSIRQV